MIHEELQTFQAMLLDFVNILDMERNIITIELGNHKLVIDADGVVLHHRTGVHHLSSTIHHGLMLFCTRWGPGLPSPMPGSLTVQKRRRKALKKPTPVPIVKLVTKARPAKVTKLKSMWQLD